MTSEYCSLWMRHYSLVSVLSMCTIVWRFVSEQNTRSRAHPLLLTFLPLLGVNPASAYSNKIRRQKYSSRFNLTYSIQHSNYSTTAFSLRNATAFAKNGLINIWIFIIENIFGELFYFSFPHALVQYIYGMQKWMCVCTTEPDPGPGRERERGLELNV